MKTTLHKYAYLAWVGLTALLAVLFEPLDRMTKQYLQSNGLLLGLEADETKQMLEQGLKTVGEKLEKALEKFEGQLSEKGKADTEVRGEVKELSENFVKLQNMVTELGQKQAEGHKQNERPMGAAQEFVKSAEFVEFAKGSSGSGRVRLETKNTILTANTGVTTPIYTPGIVPGVFRPLTIRDVLPKGTTSSSLIISTREDAFTNNAREVTEGQPKPESAITFKRVNVPIETVAHWIKVSKQVLADAPAVVAYIENRLRWGVEAKIDTQLLTGDGVSPNISGLMDTGNYTVYDPSSDDNLVDAINRAKYQLWASGYMPDAVIVNPADWGAMEISKGQDGHYLYGLPGMNSGMNPFGIRVILSPAMTAGQFLIGAFGMAVMLWEREGVVIEAGYVNADFTNNLVTLLAEARLGLEVSMPAAMLGGVWTE
jgi:HK97 family phage major capsid protein